ncbi:MAG: nitrilase-related carbon-nitrogen hydrolase [Gemmatimonadota bacterium]
MLHIAVSQFGPRLGAVAQNAKRMAEIAERSKPDLILFPELALTGYDVRDRVHDLALSSTQLPDLLELPDQTTAVVGFIEASESGIPYNSAAVIRDRQIQHVHRKVYLPTYGMFDEARYFGPGERIEIFSCSGYRLGILICEDLWHPSLCYLHACQQVDAILVMAAAPGRGIRRGNFTTASPFTSMDVWLNIACTTARLYGIYVAVCNRVGVEGGVTFAGGSLVAGPNGDPLIVSASADEQLLEAEIDRAEIIRARQPYAHLRDEDPRLVLRELQRIVASNA